MFKNSFAIEHVSWLLLDNAVLDSLMLMLKGYFPTETAKNAVLVKYIIAIYTWLFL